jgi:hypothetical protein
VPETHPPGHRRRTGFVKTVLSGRILESSSPGTGFPTGYRFPENRVSSTMNFYPVPAGKSRAVALKRPAGMSQGLKPNALQLYLPHRTEPPVRTWPAQETRDDRRDVIDSALDQGPRHIIRLGKQPRVIVPEEERNRRTASRCRFGEILADSRLPGVAASGIRREPFG